MAGPAIEVEKVGPDDNASMIIMPPDRHQMRGRHRMVVMSPQAPNRTEAAFKGPPPFVLRSGGFYWAAVMYSVSVHDPVKLPERG